MIKFFTYFLVFICTSVLFGQNIHADMFDKKTELKEEPKSLKLMYENRSVYDKSSIPPYKIKADSMFKNNSRLLSVPYLDLIDNYYYMGHDYFPHTSEHFYSVSFPSMNTNFGSFLTLDQINNYFGTNNGNPNRLTLHDKNNILNEFDSEGNGKSYFHTSLNIFSFSWKPRNSRSIYSFSISDHLNAGMSLSKQTAELILKGNELNRNYSDIEIKGKTSYVRAYSLSSSFSLIRRQWHSMKINYKIGINYLQGFAYADVENDETIFRTDNNRRITGSFRSEAKTAFSSSYGMNYDFASNKNEKGNIFFPSPAGHGLSLDFGCTVIILENESIFLNLDIKNLGFINWTENTAEHITEGKLYLDDVFNKPQLDSLEEKFQTMSNSTDQFSKVTYYQIGYEVGFDLEKLFMLDFKLLTTIGLKMNNFYLNYFVSSYFQYPSYPGIFLSYGAYNQLSTGINYSTSKYDFAIFSDNILGFISPDHKVFGLNFAWGIKF